MTTRTIWIDAGRCTGCGHCVEACPQDAITLVDGLARIDKATCTGCEACVEACPEGAIQPVIEGELVPAPARPVPSVHQASPLVETASAAIVVAGTSLLMQAARGAVQALGRWLESRSLPARSTGSANRRSGSNGRPGRSARGDPRGRRARRRRRGR